MNEEFKTIVKKVNGLYMRYGIKSITMDDVASNLGISKKTLYKYVSDKDDLVGKAVDLQIEGICTEVDCHCNSNLNAIEELLLVSKIINQRIKQVNRGSVFDLKKYYPAHYERLVKARREKMLSCILNNITKGKQEGLYRKDLDDNIIAKLQLSRIEGIIDNEFFSVDEFTSSKFFQEVFVYHIRGIANQKGIELLEGELLNFDIDDITTI